MKYHTVTLLVGWLVAFTAAVVGLVGCTAPTTQPAQPTTNPAVTEAREAQYWDRFTYLYEYNLGITPTATEKERWMNLGYALCQRWSDDGTVMLWALDAHTLTEIEDVIDTVIAASVIAEGSLCPEWRPEFDR